MEYCELGRSGIAVSRIGMGCWSFGGGAYWGEQNQHDVDRVVSAALERGINLFDTAEVYNDGASEMSLGTALKGKRSQAVIISKVKPSNASPDDLRKACENSLRRLGTDYLDVYMLHWPINPLSVQHFTGNACGNGALASAEAAFQTMMDLQKEGKIRSIGVSNFGPTQIQEAAATGARIDVLEIAFNLLCRAAEGEIIPYCAENQIGVVGYMALMQGLLTGKYTCPEQVPAPQAHSRHFQAARGGDQSRHGTMGAEKELFESLKEIRRIAAERDVPMSQLAISWVLRKQGVSTTLVGCRNERQLAENLQALEWNMDAQTLLELDRVTKPLWDAMGNSLDYYEAPEKSRIF